MTEISDEFPKTQGVELRQMREELGMSQEEVAKVVELSSLTVRNLEKGRVNNLSFRNVKKLLDFYQPNRSQSDTLEQEIDDITKGKVLRLIRNAAGKSQKDIAHKLGLKSDICIGAFERGIPKSLSPKKIDLLPETLERTSWQEMLHEANTLPAVKCQPYEDYMLALSYLMPEAGLTFQDVADRLGGVTRQAVHRFASGKEKSLGDNKINALPALFKEKFGCETLQDMVDAANALQSGADSKKHIGEISFVLKEAARQKANALDQEADGLKR